MTINKAWKEIDTDDCPDSIRTYSDSESGLKTLLLQYELYIFYCGRILKGNYPNFEYRHSRFDTTLHAWLFHAAKDFNTNNKEFRIRSIFSHGNRIMDVWFPPNRISNDRKMPQKWFIDVHNALVDYERDELSDDKLVLK